MKEEIAIIGTGFIGSELASYLSSKFFVKTFDIRDQPSFLKELNIPHKRIDVRDFEKLNKNIGNPNLLIHTAIIQLPLINENPVLGLETNLLGTYNILKVIQKHRIEKMILLSSLQVLGQKFKKKKIAEEECYNLLNLEPRSKLYVYSKALQEILTLFHKDFLKDKKFVIMRLGTVLGERMSKSSAINIFIENALKGRPITPFKHSLYRPMTYVDIRDVCNVCAKIINFLETHEGDIFNVCYPKSFTVLQTAKFIQRIIKNETHGKIIPKIRIINKNLPSIFNKKSKIEVDVSKLKNKLHVKRLISPPQTLKRIIRHKLKQINQ